MAAEMAEQPRVLEALLARREEVADQVRALAPAAPAGVVLLARGSSDNAAHYGRYILEQHLGRPVSMAAPSILTRYRADMDYSGYLVVALSQSGTTPEIVTAARAAGERGARTLAVTNDAASPLAAACDAFLPTGAGVERAVPATKTVTAQMVALAIVAHALGRPGAASADLTGLVAGVEAVLGDDGPAARVAQVLGEVDHLVVAGRGPAMAAAMEGALKVRETTGLVSDGVSVADLLHGPIRAVGDRTAVCTVDVGGPVGPDAADLAARVAPLAAFTLGCSPRADDDLPLPAGLSEAAGAVAATVRLQQVALALARCLGLDPDAPAGLSKVTLTH
ncbi:MAG: SIS domain-containing protein [Actinobacteria bacterium]|nr:SIS domain-containing protein [Actinomycetota bacterium]